MGWMCPAFLSESIKRSHCVLRSAPRKHHPRAGPSRSRHAEPDPVEQKCDCVAGAGTLPQGLVVLSSPS